MTYDPRSEVEKIAENLRIERRRWAELRETYKRCKLIAEQVWQDDLDIALCDAASSEDPLIRLKFLKEAAVALLISADRRNLSATPEPKGESSGLTESDPATILGQ